ncbi:MAG: hypothetical protein FWB74_01430 [Defluviitaleaceae bacterium]|nr:hypothetical protein [Defluviitaleaceae bacterium]
MDLVLEIQEMASFLDESKKKLVLEIIKSYLPDEELTAEDLLLIELGEQEYAEGKTTSHADIKWK